MRGTSTASTDTAPRLTVAGKPATTTRSYSSAQARYFLFLTRVPRVAHREIYNVNWFPPPLQPTRPVPRASACHRARGSGGQRGRPGPYLPERAEGRAPLGPAPPDVPSAEGSVPSARRVVYEERLLAADLQRSDPLSRKGHPHLPRQHRRVLGPLSLLGRHPGGLLGLLG